MSSGSKIHMYNYLKRPRTSLDDDEEDIENMPPKKQQALGSQEPCHSSVDSGLHKNSSPLSSDEGCTSDNGDSCSEEYSSHYTSDLPHGILSPINNIDNNKHRKHRTTSVSVERKCPLPSLSWADPCDVWNKMCERDIESAKQRSVNMLDYHQSLKLRMRAILLDWLHEVSDVYKLRRETFHLCVNYIDRYLSSTKNVHKNRLQLIGITSLFIAAKVEEIYPPKIAEFAYVTDGACSVEDLLAEEVIILKALDWKISPMTTNSWLNIYLQLQNEENTNKTLTVDKSTGEGLRSYAFFFTQYSSLDFIICAQLVDLALLHVEVNKFKYSQLAAAAIAHIFNKDIAIKVSSYSWKDLRPCYVWLAPFARVLEEEFKNGETGGESHRTMPDCGNAPSTGGLSLICPNINVDQAHRVQIHNISLTYFDKVEKYIDSQESESDEACNAEEDDTSTEASESEAGSLNSPRRRDSTNVIDSSQ